MFQFLLKNSLGIDTHQEERETTHQVSHSGCLFPLIQGSAEMFSLESPHPPAQITFYSLPWLYFSSWSSPSSA